MTFILNIIRALATGKGKNVIKDTVKKYTQRDYNITYFGFKTLEKSYLLKKIQTFRRQISVWVIHSIFGTPLGLVVFMWSSCLQFFMEINFLAKAVYTIQP